MRRYRRRSKSSPIALERKTILTIIGILILGFSLLLFLSIFTKSGALLSLKDRFYDLFGIGIIFVPPLLIVTSFPLLSVRSRFARINFIFGFTGALLSLIALFASISTSFSGIIGQTLWSVIATLVTPIGAFFSLSLTFLISLVIAFNTSVDQAITILVNSYQAALGFLKSIRLLIFRPKTKFAQKSQAETYGFSPAKDKSSVKPKELGSTLTPNLVVNPPGQNQIWEYPPLSLLSDVRGGAANRGNVKQSAHILEKTLEAFGITAKVVEINPGPTVTQYALEIPVGTKLSKILTLHNDLALALATPTGNVRIEAPIPGKSLVGIEIPNISPEVVSLKNVLSDEKIRANKSKLAVPLGLDVSGNSVISDIAKMPHVLIAGTTGSGKSVLLNALIATILFRASPQEVKFIIVDPKRVELSVYNDIPHLLTPIIIDPGKILSALKWAIVEMERRYKLFHEAQVKNIAGYNELSGFQALPYIVIVVDELQNLMEFAPVEVENAVSRLAAMARATGIHLLIATQRPSVDVITGLIKANIPCRIAFNVSSMVDSRVIIDQPGAEKLLGRGDMLYVPPEAAKPMRIQGVYVSDTEIRNLTSFLKKFGIPPEYTEEVTSMPISKMSGSGAEGGRDPLFEEAVRTICQHDKASSSFLQRRLRIGYARAARLIDELEMAGIVGPGEGSKPRDVLVKNADEFLASQSSS